TTKSPMTDDAKYSNNNGLIVTIIVIIIVIVILAMVLALLLYRRKRAKEETITPIYAQVDGNSPPVEYTELNTYALPSNHQPEYHDIEPKNNRFSMKASTQNEEHDAIVVISTQSNPTNEELEPEYQTLEVSPSEKAGIISEKSQSNPTYEELEPEYQTLEVSPSEKSSMQSEQGDTNGDDSIDPDDSVPDKSGKPECEYSINDTHEKNSSEAYIALDKDGHSKSKSQNEEDIEESSDIKGDDIPEQESSDGNKLKTRDQIENAALDDESNLVTEYCEPGKIINNGKNDNDNGDDDDEVNYYSTPVTNETDASVRPNSALYAKVNKNTKTVEY
uniref:Uncharacterized protein n=1 Tax=Clytia hemisphaerica TaxID=252671 RepID=A0A7M5UGM4_9CNID